jgi:hypothetical protein
MFLSRETKENLEQCEKMYIEKFKELMKLDNAQYSYFVRNKINRIKIYDDLPYNKFYTSDKDKVITYPLIALDSDNKFINFYKIINIGDEISIWGVNK